MQEKETSNFRGSFQGLYEAGREAWANFSDHQESFITIRPRYSGDYAAARLLEIDAAEAMPADNTRGSLSEDNRILLARGADDCCFQWQNLKSYVQDAYDADRSAVMLKAAGQPSYLAAAQDNWQSVKTLMNDGSAFIAAHQADLVANDNMPPGFGNTFNVAKDAFAILLGRFFGSVTDGSTAGQNKIKANNAVYAKLSKMMKDGQRLFAKDESIRSLFVLTNIRALVGGTAQAGLYGFVTNIATGLPIASATVVTANNVYTAITDSNGRYDLKGMAANDYILTVTAAGYAEQTMLATVKTGTVSTVNVDMAASVVI